MNTAKTVRRVLVVSATRQAHELMMEILPPGGFSPIVHVTSAGEAKRLLTATEFDLALINAPLPDESGAELARELAGRNMGVLLLCRSDVYEGVACLLEEDGVMTLPRPVTKQELYVSIRLLCAMCAKLSKMEKQNRTLQEKMADIRAVNRAKWLLIEHLGMSEKDAHYHIEKQAMDMRLSRREVAEYIVRTYDK